MASTDRRDGTFSRSDFPYDHARDLYTCPAGKELRPRQKVYRPSIPLVDEDGMMRYRASKFDCDPCCGKATWRQSCQLPSYADTGDERVIRGLIRRPRSGSLYERLFDDELPRIVAIAFLEA